MKKYINPSISIDNITLRDIITLSGEESGIGGEKSWNSATAISMEDGTI